MKNPAAQFALLFYLFTVFYHPLVMGVHGGLHFFETSHTEAVAHEHSHEESPHFHSHENENQEEEKHLNLLVFNCLPSHFEFSVVAFPAFAKNYFSFLENHSPVFLKRPSPPPQFWV